MKPKVLILSGLYDFSTDLVCLRLKKLGVAFLRLNREHLHEFRFALNPTLPEMRITGHGLKAEISAELKSIWFRQPIFLRNTPSDVLSIEEQLNRSQWTAFLRSLSVFDSTAWMNWPQSTYLAESKPYQLLAAIRCGFKVPKTLVGNDAMMFQKELQGDLIIKSLDTVLLKEGNDCLFTYSTVFNSDSLKEEQVASVPLLAQDYIEKKIDVRVTVIGEKIYAVIILSEGSPIKGDWRIIPKEFLEYQDIELPKEILEACKLLTKKLRLSFAAIDLLKAQDDYYFLEVNPTGEWGWLSNESRPIDLTIAKWLSEPKGMQ